MTKTITRDDVLRYIFKETSSEENLAIENQLILNSNLMDFYEQSMQILKRVNQLSIEPSERITNNIIDFSDYKRFESIS